MGLIHFQAELFTTCATGLRASVIRYRMTDARRPVAQVVNSSAWKWMRPIILVQLEKSLRDTFSWARTITALWYNWRAIACWLTIGKFLSRQREAGPGDPAAPRLA